MSTVVVFTGGEPLPSSVAGDIPDDAYMIAADSGLDHALGLGYDVDLVVGDLDSVGTEALAITAATVERHSPDKDATDLDLALTAAMARDPDRIIVIGGQGGRFDHLVGTISLLTSPRWETADLEWVAARARVRVIHTGISLQGAPGTVVTLLALDGPATGVTTTGLRWDLADATLVPGSTHGVSNEFTGPVATVRVATGTLLAIQPDPA